MKIAVVCYQKRSNSALGAAEQEYLKRLSRHADVELITVRRWDDESPLPRAALEADRRIGLFVDGRMHSSEGLAGRLQQLLNGGRSRLAVVIGAAEGMPGGAAAQIDERWALSRLTFSHQLARLLLLEALYRSFDILHGGRYHK